MQRASLQAAMHFSFEPAVHKTEPETLIIDTSADFSLPLMSGGWLFGLGLLTIVLSVFFAWLDGIE